MFYIQHPHTKRKKNKGENDNEITKKTCKINNSKDIHAQFKIYNVMNQEKKRSIWNVTQCERMFILPLDFCFSVG